MSSPKYFLILESLATAETIVRSVVVQHKSFTWVKPVSCVRQERKADT